MSTDIEYISPLSSTAFPTEWYEWADPRHFWIRWRFEALVRFLKSLNIPMQENQKWLDIGGGNGVLGAQIESATEWNVDCAELNLNALKKNHLGKGRRLYYDIQNITDEMRSYYDGIFLFDVIEHIEDPIPFLKSSLAHVKPGGWIAINVPALPHFLVITIECKATFAATQSKVS